MKQVCCLKLAKRLKELGVKQKSLFYWMTFKNTSSSEENRDKELTCIIHAHEKQIEKEKSYLKDVKFYSAFTVAELGEGFPAYVGTAKDEKGNWLSIFPPQSCVFKGFHGASKTEADCRAKIRIHLLEEFLRIGK